MKKFLFRSVYTGCFLFALNFGHAQPVVTEYFVMKTGFKIDLTDKKIQKTVYSKGVIDIVWSTSNMTLSITYDPKLTDGKDILKSIQDVAGLNSASIQSQPANSK